jgi:hypothetical protein
MIAPAEPAHRLIERADESFSLDGEILGVELLPCLVEAIEFGAAGLRMRFVLLSTRVPSRSKMIRLFMRARARRFPIAAKRDPSEGARIDPDDVLRRGMVAICRSAAAKASEDTSARSAAPSLGELLADRL